MSTLAQVHPKHKIWEFLGVLAGTTGLRGGTTARMMVYVPEVVVPLRHLVGALDWESIPLIRFLPTTLPTAATNKTREAPAPAPPLRPFPCKSTPQEGFPTILSAMASGTPHLCPSLELADFSRR